MAYEVLATKDAENKYIYASEWRQIRDNWIAGVPDIFVMKGDIAVASAANTAGIATNAYSNRILQCDSGDPNGVIYSPFGVYMRHNASSYISSYAGEAERYIDDVETEDARDVIAATSAGQYTVQRSGLYLVLLHSLKAYVSTSAPVASKCRLYIKVGDTIQTCLAYEYSSDGMASGADILELTAGNALKFYMYYFIPGYSSGNAFAAVAQVSTIGLIRLGAL